MKEMAWETVLPIAVSVGMFVLALLTLRRNTEQDTSAIASERATLNANVQYISGAIDEIKLENRAIRTDLDELKVKVAEIDSATKSAHKRLDDLKKG